MGKLSREKGARGEREAIMVLHDALMIGGTRGLGLHRNLRQYQVSGEHDIIGFANYAIEVKRYKTITPAMLERFWDEAVEQTKDNDLIPVLMYRGDRQPWRIIYKLDLIQQCMCEKCAGLKENNYLFTVNISPEMFSYIVYLTVDNEYIDESNKGDMH